MQHQPAYRLATKIETLEGRGEEDYLGSRDRVDAVALVDSREELVAEVQQAEPELNTYLAGELARVSDHPRSREGVGGERTGRHHGFAVRDRATGMPALRTPRSRCSTAAVDPFIRLQVGTGRNPTVRCAGRVAHGALS